MTDVKGLAQAVFNGREEAEKRIENGENEQVKKKIAENYVKEILEIFKLSNLSESAVTPLVWQVKLCCLEREGKCFVMFSFEQKEEAQFSNIHVFDCSPYYIDDNSVLKEHIRKLEIPKELFAEIYDYFKENLSEYFETTKPDSKHIVIKLKSKK